jgi:predicted nuclease with TOPRIM domain
MTGTGVETIDWASLPPMALLAVTLIVALAFLWKTAQIGKEMQSNALAAGSQATIEALKAFRETQAESRIFYMDKLEVVQTNMRAVKDEMRELKEQLDEKNSRIEDLERENKNKTTRIAELEEEVNALRKRLDEKTKGKPRASKGKGAPIAGAGL